MSVQRTKSSWFAFYPEDYMGGTRVMSLAAKGAYVDLLAHQFTHGFIPDNDRLICRILGAMPDEWAAVKDEVLPKFERVDAGKLANARMTAEREERAAIRTKRIEASKAARAKREQQKEAPDTSHDAPCDTSHGQPQDPVLHDATTTTTTTTTKYHVLDQDRDPPAPTSGGGEKADKPPTPPAPPPSLESRLGEFLSACGAPAPSGAIDPQALYTARDRSTLFLDRDLLDDLCRRAGAWRKRRDKAQADQGRSFRPLTALLAVEAIDEILATDPGSNGSGRVRIKDEMTRERAML